MPLRLLGSGEEWVETTSWKQRGFLVTPHTAVGSLNKDVSDGASCALCVLPCYLPSRARTSLPPSLLGGTLAKVKVLRPSVSNTKKGVQLLHNVCLDPVEMGKIPVRYDRGATSGNTAVQTNVDYATATPTGRRNNGVGQTLTAV